MARFTRIDSHIRVDRLIRASRFRIPEPVRVSLYPLIIVAKNLGFYVPEGWLGAVFFPLELVGTNLW